MRASRSKVWGLMIFFAATASASGCSDDPESYVPTRPADAAVHDGGRADAGGFDAAVPSIADASIDAGLDASLPARADAASDAGARPDATD
ncbi:MAG: hypothetical protein JWN48_3881 [Myxococcaceae bacterium]|nr:hypothetical protein [Myxococcaceae bacterium]